MAASNDNGYDLRAPRDRSLRVGDKERDAVVEILRAQHMEGRLDADEFQARIDRCLAAKTYAELDALLADFPREEAEPRRAPQRSRPAWPLPFPFFPLALIAAIVLATHGVWLVVPLLLFWVFVVRRGAWACGPRRTRRI
jgi:hypothetical protein